ncbi:MAG: LamB/YcsF family protein [Desulfomicrobium escambiense]|nr:LamB/YcsF family protein [Desulfomicrobium escambiense]
MIHDEAECVSRVLRAVREGTVLSEAGKVVPIRAETVCLHGDNPEAWLSARWLRAALEGEGIVVRPAGTGRE